MQQQNIMTCILEPMHRHYRQHNSQNSTSALRDWRRKTPSLCRRTNLSLLEIARVAPSWHTFPKFSITQPLTQLTVPSTNTLLPLRSKILPIRNRRKIISEINAIPTSFCRLAIVWESDIAGCGCPQGTRTKPPSFHTTLFILAPSCERQQTYFNTCACSRSNFRYCSVHRLSSLEHRSTVHLCVEAFPSRFQYLLCRQLRVLGSSCSAFQSGHSCASRSSRRSKWIRCDCCIRIIHWRRVCCPTTENQVSVPTWRYYFHQRTDVASLCDSVEREGRQR